MSTYEVVRETADALTGTRKVVRFPNGYGASIVRGPYTYGGPDLYEIAVLKFNGDGWDLTYDTPVTNDVIGWLDDQGVDDTLEQIGALP